MKPRRLDKREFAEATQRGFGRALLHVREYGDDGIEDVLLNACLHNLLYDRQSEDGRSWWLMQMLPHTRSIEFYADKIKQALVENADETGFNQQVLLACYLFEQGFSEFKDILSGLVPRNVEDEGLRVLAEALLQVNGFAGLKAGVALMQENKAEPWEKVSVYESAAEELNSVEVADFLEKEAKNNPLIAEFLNDVHAELRQRDQESLKREPLTLLQIINAVENEPVTRKTVSPYRSFGKHATDQELLTIVERLEREDNPDRLYAYLSVFEARALPVTTPKTLGLLTAQDKNVRRTARNALALVKSPAVRQLALETIRREDDESIAYGLEILQLNFQSEDAELILQSLKNVTDPDCLHWSGSAVRDTADHSVDPSVLSDCLTLLYDIDPCGFCRGSTLSRLIKLGRAPEELLYEAQWDANGGTRIIARGAIAVK